MPGGQFFLILTGQIQGFGRASFFVFGFLLKALRMNPLSKFIQVVDRIQFHVLVLEFYLFDGCQMDCAQLQESLV